MNIDTHTQENEMYTMTAEIMQPFSSAVAEKISKFINFIYDNYQEHKASKEALEVARMLKIEYPYETYEYVFHMVKNPKEC